jgi:holliday junction DNA helicase RuvA
MIGFLKGRLAVKQPPMLMVDVNGVGYEMEAPMSTFYGLPATGEPVALFTHLVVREDAHILYAFGTDGERRLFRGLLKVSGVGPKIALGILSGSSVDDFLRTVEAEDIAMLTRIPGIGRKTAERMCVELRDKLEGFGAPQPVVSHSAVEEDVISALSNLGFQRALAEKAVERAVQSAGRDNFDAIFRAALGALSK